MEWLSGGGDLLGPALGLTGTGITITAAVWYVVKFLHAFTERLEEDAERATKKIDHLERRLARAQGRESRATRRLGHALFLLAQNGIRWVDPIPEPPEPLLEDDEEDEP